MNISQCHQYRRLRTLRPKDPALSRYYTQLQLQRRFASCTAPLSRRQFRTQRGLNILLIRNSGVRMPTGDAWGGGRRHYQYFTVRGHCPPPAPDAREHPPIFWKQGAKWCSTWGNTLLTYLLHGAESFLRSWPCLQLLKKFPAFYGTRKFIAVFTSARHLSLSWANSIQSPPPPTSWRSILILSSHLRLGTNDARYRI